VPDVRAARVAWALAGVTLVLVLADAAVTAQYHHLLSEASVAVHGFPFVDGAVLGCALMGALIVASDPRHPIGWLLSLIGLSSALSLVAEAYALWVLHEGGPGPNSLGGLAGWVALLMGGQLAIAGLGLLFLLAPDGRLLSPRWRYAAGVIVAGELLCWLGVVSANPATFDPVSESDGVGPVRAVLLSLGFLLISAGLLASLVSMLLRLHRSQGVQRQQVRLIALSAALITIALICLFVVQGLNGGRQTWASSLPLFASYLLLPVLFAIAVRRYRLYNIELILNRTLLLAAATAFAALGYTTLVVVVSKLVDRQTGGFWISLLAIALVALAFQPIRRSVVRLANRLAYGPRAQPYEALSDFSSRLAETPSPRTLLSAVAHAAGHAVSARSATASLAVPDDDGLSATWGPEDPDGTVSHVVPMRADGRDLGAIEVWLPRGRPLRPSDRRLLAALADQTAVAFRNLALERQLAGHVADLDRAARELNESRLRLIETDDAARRTLEAAIARDVLPRLVELPGAVRAARAVVAAGVPTTGIAGLVADTNAALESLRELTRGVFPTQLERSGLEPALRSFLTRSAPVVTLGTDDEVAGRRFPPRIEAAIYFCCVEAVGAETEPATIALTLDGDELVLRISGTARTDIDVRAIADRAEAIGGSLTAGSNWLTLSIPVGQVGSARPEPALVGHPSGGVLPRR
jgi:hypothetical protein